MSANPKFLAATAQVDEAAVRPLPSSRKVYVGGSRPDIRVPMREISQSDTPAGFGAEKNPPVTVYDTSGPYTDPEARIDVRKGLAALRSRWIEERGDTELLEGPSSEFGRRRFADAKLAELRFELKRAPRRAKAGGCVTQMHYARRGIVTPEMEFIAIRENQRAEALSGLLTRQHRGERQPPGIRADGDRPQLPGEDQLQHRQLRGHFLDRRGSGQDDLGDSLGRRHGNGSLHRQAHQRDARVDRAQQPRSDRHRADLPGAREGERQGRGADLGDLPRYAGRAGRAGGGLLHHPRRSAAAVHSAHGEPHDRDRVARRLDHGQVVPGPSRREFPLYALWRDLR